MTDRKRFAAARSQRRQRESLPLLGPLIAETQPSIDEVMTSRVATWIKTEQQERDRRAELWRRARRDLDGRAPAVRAALLAYWNGHRWLPGDPSYLLDMLHTVDARRLILADGQVRPARAVIAVGEAVGAVGRSKPVAGGWLRPRCGRSMQVESRRQD